MTEKKQPTFGSEPTIGAPTCPGQDLGIPVGTLIDGKYRVAAPLGDGAMGLVLRATDETLERDVAIKLIRAEVFESQTVRDQFLVEARSMARIRHPNVVDVYAFGFHEGAPFFVMEYVPGQNMAHWVKARGGPPISVDEALGLMEQVCRGVAAIHEAGLVHRDIKPSNVLIGPAFRVAIADLGLTAAVEGAGTTWGGTPTYMAPEVAARLAIQPELASRIDIYALGVMVYELLVGRPPFEHADVNAVMLMHVEEDARTPSEVRPELTTAFDALLRRALHKDPSRRFGSALELRDALLAARGQAAPDSAGNRVRVVAADDDEDFRDWLTVVLESTFPGAELVVVADGDAALAAGLEESTDLAVIDLQMPGLNGLELTAAMRQHPSLEKTPIIVLTAVGGAPDWQLLQRMGADGFLIKPTDPIALTALARQLVQRARGE